MYTQPYSLGALTSVKLGRRARLRVGGAVLVTLGVGHSYLLYRAENHIVRGWIKRGLVDTVQVGVWEAEPVERRVMEERLHFWAGLGSFTVPTTLLGLLVLDTAQGDRPLPRWLGPALIAWSGLTSVIMPKAPWPLFAASGALIASAAAPRSGGVWAAAAARSLP